MLQILLIELMVFLFAAILPFIKPTHLCWRRGLSRRFYKHKYAILPARRGISLKTKTLEPSQACTRDEFLKCASRYSLKAPNLTYRFNGFLFAARDIMLTQADPYPLKERPFKAPF